ncbi:MAG: chloride channel protein [Halobacteriales archaeon]|nr:chloride channel protein [Halobacteriales archaeon]
MPGALRERGIFAVSLAAVLAGLVGGLAAVGFRALVSLVTTLSFFHEPGPVFRAPLDHHLGLLVVLVPLAGGALIAVLTRLLPGEGGVGTPEVIEAASLRGGQMPLVRTLKGALLAALSLGTGGSAGREGPIVQLGGLAGGITGATKWFGRQDRRVLVACGAVAALAATFNAPIAAVVFGLEVVLLEFRTQSFVPLVIASVAGTSVGRFILGNKPTFVLPPDLFALGSPAMLPLYALLGVGAGLLGVVLLAMFEAAEAWKPPGWLPPIAVPVLGGAALGVFGLVEPRLLGVGYETVNGVFNHELASPDLLGLLLILLALKPLAVVVTLRAGGSGGVFSPTFFEGACFGLLFGLGVQHALPNLGADPASFALVGMAALFAAVSRATLTAIVLVVELTLSFDIVLPVMLACVLADLIAWTRHPGSLYSTKLAAKGRPVPAEVQPNVLDVVLVAEVMERDAMPLAASASLRDYLDRSMATGRQAFPLVDVEGRLNGIVTRTDLRLRGGTLTLERPIAALATRDVIVAFPDETVHMAIDKMVARNIGYLPVVDRSDPGRIVGWLTREKVLSVERLRLDTPD